MIKMLKFCHQLFSRLEQRCCRITLYDVQTYAVAPGFERVFLGSVIEQIHCKYFTYSNLFCCFFLLILFLTLNRQWRGDHLIDDVQTIGFI